MKKSASLILVLPLALAFVGSAFAVELWTPPLRSNGDVLGCTVLNLGPGSVQVNAKLIDGGVVKAEGTLTISPGVAQEVTYTSSDVYAATCKFTFNGSKKKVRGFATIVDSGGSTTRLIVEAR